MKTAGGLAWDYSPWVQITYRSNFYVGRAIADLAFDDGSGVDVVRTFVLQTALNARAAGEAIGGPFLGPLVMLAGDRLAMELGADSWIQSGQDGVVFAGIAPPGFRGWAITLSHIADDVRMAASHQAAANMRVIAVGMDSKNVLYVAHR